MHHTAIDDAAWDSPWRRHPVGDKVLLSLGLVLVALVSDPWPGCALVFTLAITLMLAPARVPPGLVAAVLTAPVVFLLLGTAPIVVQWQPTAGVGSLALTRQGLVRAGELWAHSLAGTAALVLLAMTTPMADLLVWLRRLRVPEPLLEVASLTYRLLFMLLSTTLGIRAAQRARLGDAAPWRRRWTMTAHTVGTVLVFTGRRVARLHEGLEGRGMDEGLPTLAPTTVRTRWFLVLALGCPLAIWSSGLVWGWLR